MNMQSGTLYGIGVGPGDPELLTLKAVSIIKACPVVASPRTRGGTAALDIARGAVDLSGKTILPLDFAMTHDRAQRERSHRAAAEAVGKELDAGRDVAFLNLGDVSLYASFQYVWDILKPRGHAMRMIPGVTSFSAAAAELGISLANNETPVRIVPNGTGAGAADDDNRDGGGATTIWMKSGRHLTKLLADLKAQGRLSRAMLVQNCGMADQRVYSPIGDADAPNDYFSVVIEKHGEKHQENGGGA